MMKDKSNVGNLKVDRLNVVKYVVTAAIIIYIAVILAYKGESKVPFEKVAANVEKAADTSLMKKGNAQTFKKLYGLNAKDYDGVMLYSAKSAMGAEELLVLRLKDASQTEVTEKAVEKRLEDRKKVFEGYGVNQMKLLQNAVYTTRGNYIFLAVSSDAQKFQKAFTGSL